MDDLRCL